MSHQETIVMSVGGSMIVPDQIDTEFLTELKTLLLKEIAAGRQFVVITGGGKVCRRYQDAARSLGTVSNEELDWIGISSTQLNGRLVHAVFEDVAHKDMIINPEHILTVPTDAKLIVATGFEPGTSSDYRAVQAADYRQATKVINLSNTDYVYTADPRTNSDAQKLEDITWADFRKLIPEEWDPGLSVPFDPIAAKLAQEKNIEVANINGKNLTELQNYLDGKAFVGTRIHN